MAAQYDTIQASYDVIRRKTIAHIEHENVHTTVAPFIHGARVLDLACGSGFYTYDFLHWGAESVLGVDISAMMIDEARRHERRKFPGARNLPSARGAVDFVRADCSTPTAYAGGPFDLVFGAWLLNYAPDYAGLVEMFRNIGLNLKPGGRLVSVTVPPAADPVASMHAELHARPGPDWSGGLVYSHVWDVADGFYLHVHGDTEVGPVDFDCYHLRRDVYEAAAREAGLRGELTWEVTSVPERYLRGEGPGGSSMVEVESYQTVPNYGLLVIVK